MEAFSDGVIAVIITVMVLELRVPAHSLPDLEGLRRTLPMLMIYALSFVEVGIYWVNHHYLIDDVERVSHGLLWANLSFLFTLSLIPFGTAWVGERGVTPFAVSLYSICCSLPAVSWIVLSIIVRRQTRLPFSGSPIKQAISAILYIGAIPVSHYSVSSALMMLGSVAILWFIPPKRIFENRSGQNQGVLSLRLWPSNNARDKG
jgi:TMEM175 potassium channel family protein